MPFAGHRRLFERAAISCGVVAGHVLVFGLMTWHIPVVHRDPAGIDGLVVLASLIDAAPAPSQPAQSQPAKPTASPPEPAIEHTPAPLPEDKPPAEPQLSLDEATALDSFELAVAAGDPDQPCDLTSMLNTGFARSEAVRQGLDELPQAQRSVANAVMLWDGSWPDDTATGGKALLRAVLVKAIAQARPDCLTQAQRGPVLFLVPDDTATVVLAVGSGQWRWGDLLSSQAESNYFAPVASVIPTAP